MHTRIIGLGLLAATVLTACSGTGSSPTAPSATSTASSAASTTAPASTAAVVASSSASGTCPLMGDADAATLLSSAGAGHVISADSPAGTVTTCRWGAALGQPNSVVLLVTDLKIDAAIAAAKSSIGDEITEKITGLGDNGGFSEKGADLVAVVFIKGSTTVMLVVGVTGVNADSVAALAFQIAAKL